MPWEGQGNQGISHDLIKRGIAYLLCRADQLSDNVRAKNAILPLTLSGSGILDSRAPSPHVSTHDGSLRELGELEDSHGSVPDNGLGIGQGLVEDVQGLGADVQTHPAVGDGVDVNNLNDKVEQKWNILILNNAERIHVSWEDHHAKFDSLSSRFSQHTIPCRWR